MQMTFRWYGDGNDDITPEMIRQIPGGEWTCLGTSRQAAGRDLDGGRDRESASAHRGCGFSHGCGGECQRP